MSGHNTGAVLEGRATRRGTSNSNDRGSSADRRARRVYLVTTYRADVDLLIDRPIDELLGTALVAVQQETVPLGDGEPCCRCYRCGWLLTVDTVSPDRIVPGCEGGRYVRSNIRPACNGCQSTTGGVLGAQRKAS